MSRKDNSQVSESAYLDPSQKSVSYERVPENPLRERLEIIHEQFAGEANNKEVRAEELEREAASLRAEARGLRAAQEGVSRAIKEFVEAQAKNAKRFEDPNDINIDEESYDGGGYPPRTRRQRHDRHDDRARDLANQYP